ncbi:MAG: acyltransferase family protein, partial [Bacillota bacterium]
MKKRRIEEIDLLRSIAIICVVIVHSVSRVIEIYESHNMLLSYQKDILLTIRLFTTFGTPIFIFLSVFLLAYAYSDHLPDNFMKKRVKLILIPYISMALIYAFIMVHENGFLHNGDAVIKYIQYFIENIFTGFYRHGYFIIVIFQFYIIYKLFNKKLKKINTIKLLSFTFFINILYLMFF